MSNRYEIRAKIGAGGMGAVYRAYDSQLKREVALKRLHPQDQKAEEARKTAEFLIQEAGVLSKLQHPNIVTVYDCGIDDDGGYVVMELISGETLNETIKRGALPLKDFNSVVEQSLEGLVAAQEVGMLHRDIKPTNVMIRWFPSGSFQLKLLDFGLAKVGTEPSHQTIDHRDSILGSIYFMSPEQFEREKLDARTDLYSLGCLLYYCLAGRFPFRGKTAADVMVAHLEGDVAPLQPIRPDIPSGICDWVMRMMARDRDDRPVDARVALREFTALLAALPKKPAGSVTGPLPAVPSPNPRLVLGVPAPSLDTGSQRVSTTTVLRPLHRANKKRGWIWSLSAAAAAVVAVGAYLIWVPNGDSKTGEGAALPSPDEETIVEAPFVLPVENPDADSATVLLPFGATWKYAPAGEAPSDDWTTFDFDDTAWASGASPIGYGDKGLHTEIDVKVSGKTRPMSLSYRTRFEVSTPPDQGGYADIQVVADDAALVFLNGTEIARVGLRAGPLEQDTSTIRKMDAETEGWITRARFPASLVRTGSNVLAVRVYQTNPTSSDSWLDIKVALCKPGTPESTNAALVRAEGFKEVVPTADSDAREWRYTFTDPGSAWAASSLSGDNSFTAKGRPASSSFPGKTPRIPWSEENLWMTRTFWIGANDLAKREGIALKVLHTGNVVVYLNGRLAAERLGSGKDYVALPIAPHALDSLKPGENRLSVFSAGGKLSQAVDVGIIRLDKRVSSLR